jgi:predicted amidophosphoribosyltransferase
MTTCTYCGKPIETGKCLCVNCVAKSKTKFYRNLAIFPFNHAVDEYGSRVEYMGE